jgi:glutamate mutase epsilon subunit
MLQDSGFTDIEIGTPYDTFGGAGGEENARAFEVYGYAFLARKPG